MTRATRIGAPVTVKGSGGNRIACQVAGPVNAQPVILTSGIGCGPVFYKHIAPALTKEYRVIFWDYRAHGGSDLAPDRRSYRIDDHADDLAAVVQALADRPPVMVAFSMGVQVTLEWVQRYDASGVPAYVFLLGMPRNPLRSNWFWGNRRMRNTVDRILDSGGDRIIPHLHPVSKAILRNRVSYAIAKKWGLVTGEFDYRDYDEFIRYSSGVRPDAYLRTATGVLDHDALDAWQQLDKPTLFIAASRDMLVPADQCRGVAHLLPGGRYGELEGRSHAGMVEAGPDLGVQVRDFIEKQLSTSDGTEPSHEKAEVISNPKLRPVSVNRLPYRSGFNAKSIEGRLETGRSRIELTQKL